MASLNWRPGFGVALLGGVGGLIVVVATTDCQPDNWQKAPDRICTPGNYVFCRCEDRDEGTKLCLEDGTSFDPCKCPSTNGGRPPPLNPTGDAGFEEVDAAARTDAGGRPPIDARCAGKLAVIASSDQEIDLYGAAYTGQGKWTVAKSTGPALRSMPRGAVIGTDLVAVWRTRFNLIAWTKFQTNQTTLAPPVSVGSAITGGPPSFVRTENGSIGALFYVGLDDAFASGIYNANSGWDDATTAVPVTGTIAMKGAPALATTRNGGRALSFSADDKVLRTQASGDAGAQSWNATETIATATLYNTTDPAMTTLVGGPAAATQDLLIAYLGSDLLFHSMTHNPATGAWSAPIVVDTLATSDSAPGLATMSDGRAMMVWKAANGTPYFSIYDPKNAGGGGGGGGAVWSPPAAIGPAMGSKISAPPSIAPGRCASEATVTWVVSSQDETNGLVLLALYDSGEWKGPYEVPGLAKMTFAGAGEAP